MKTKLKRIERKTMIQDFKTEVIENGTILCKYGIIISDVTLCITPLHQELSTF